MQSKKEFIKITERKSGNGVCYELRYRRNGIEISASSKNFNTAERKFFDKAKKILSKSELLISSDIEALQRLTKVLEMIYMALLQ